MHAHDIITLCGILIAGFACQWVAWRLRVPAILFLLVAGIAAGPVFGLLNPDELLGDLMLTFVSIAVAVILFEGSLTLKISQLGGRGNVVRNLVTIGVLITWAGSALAAHFLLGWDVYLAALFGAIVTVSGPTVVMPLLRTVRPKSSVSSVLRWEAILIDPLGAILGLLVFDFIVASQDGGGTGEALRTVVVMVLAGTLLGAAGGYLFGLALRRRLIPDFLRDYSGLAAALTVFAAAEAIRGESGLLAVTVMGIWLANMRGVDLADILDFKESLTLLLVAGLFIILAARLDLSALQAIGWAALGVLLVLQLIAGPLRALVCSWGSSLSIREQLFLGWVFPRGIVAAAISALFALRLEAMDYEGADGLVPLVFTVIIGTVVIQSLTTGAIARWLDVAEPPPTGVLITGANTLGVAIARALHERDIPVLVADSHWESVRDARMQGLPTFFGSAVSAYADNNIDLSGLGNLLALTRRAGFNELACVRYAEEFGRDHVFTMQLAEDGKHRKHSISGEQGGRMLYGGEHSLMPLLERLESGAQIKSTVLTAEFSLESYEQQFPDNLPIFFVDVSGYVRFPVPDNKLKPAAGWVVAAIVPGEIESPAA